MKWRQSNIWSKKSIHFIDYVININWQEFD